MTKETLIQSKEILTAYEHTVYERFYHGLEARKVLSLASRRTFIGLQTDPNPDSKIWTLLFDYRLGRAVRGRILRKDIKRAQAVGSISLRSFFTYLPEYMSEMEVDLATKLTSVRKLGDVAVGVLRYSPPDSQHAIEPDHEYVDAYILGEPHSYHVGYLMKWFADEFDSPRDGPRDEAIWMSKPTLGRNYERLIDQLLRISWPDVNIEMKPWPLSRLGKFASQAEHRDEISIWLSASDLTDPLTKHILRKTSSVPQSYSSISEELKGLSQLRRELINSWSRTNTLPRKRFFQITASIHMYKKDGEEIIHREFDGGMLQISARTGAARLYLLETKSGQTARRAANVLQEKIDALDLSGSVHLLPRRSAYALLII